MSASVAVTIPLFLLALVFLFCFVGCTNPFDELVVEAPPEPFTKYSDETVLTTPGLVAYWPLGEEPPLPPGEGEEPGEITAVDRKNGFNGTYTTPAPYPDPDDPTFQPLQTAWAPGTFELGKPGIVPGDTVQPQNDPNVLTTCLQVDGGFVKVPFDFALNPAPSVGWTIEAWVRIGWEKDDPPARRCVLASYEQQEDPKIRNGFGLWVGSGNKWEVVVGNGTEDIHLEGTPVVWDATAYVVATYDGPTQTLRLFVDGMERGAMTTSYAPNGSRPLFIGAGGTELPIRPQPPGVLAGPLWPFKGLIQDVAVYQGALPLTDPSGHDVLTHSTQGNGLDINP